MFPLHTLRGLAQREMGAVRRSGASLVLTRTGRLMADDPGPVAYRHLGADRP